MQQKSDGPSDRSPDTGIENGAGSMTRRAAMTIMTAITATPALSFVAARPAFAGPVDRREWDRTTATLERAEGEYVRISAAHTAAFDAADADCPREEKFFCRYNLGWPRKMTPAFRKRNVEAAQMALWSERKPANGAYFDDNEASDMRREAERVVDEFYAWGKRSDEAHKLHRCDEWEARFNAAVDRRWNAQEAVLSAKAPDFNAVLAKLELLAEMMDGEQDQERVMAIRDDARRLLTVTH